jgi:hypothetical protein
MSLTLDEETHDNNTIGARAINTLVNQYFIKGGLPKKRGKENNLPEKVKTQ